MGESSRRAGFRLLCVGLIAIFFQGCTTQINRIGGLGKASIFGTLLPFVGLLSERSSSAPNLAHASTCDTSEVRVFLFKLDSNGRKILPAVATTQPTSAGYYSFTQADLVEAVLAGKDRFVVEATGCVAGAVFSRPITGTSAQDVMSASSLLAAVANLETSQSRKLRNAPLAAIDSFLTRLHTRVGNTLSIQDAYAELTGDPTLEAEFISLFGFAPSLLRFSIPWILELQVPRNLSEGVVANYQATLSHWNPSYDPVVLWRLDGIDAGTGTFWSHTPIANSVPTQLLSLFVGHDDGSGEIDLTKPYLQRDFLLTNQDSLPPMPPAFLATESLIEAGPVYRVFKPGLAFSLDTGAARANCRSFSVLALVEGAGTPDASDFTITCTAAGTQSVPLTLANTSDGPKTLRLYARDIRGTISAPREISLLLDQTPPTVAFVTPAGGALVSAATMGSLALSGTCSAREEGQTVSLSGALAATATCTAGAWATTALDLSGLGQGAFTVYADLENVGGVAATQASRSFTKDSVAPATPVLALDSPTITNLKSASFHVANCTDTSHILLSESATAPLATDAGWIPCSTVPATLAYANAGWTDGSKSIYAWARDAAGNISATSATESLLYDATAPAAPSLAPVGEAFATTPTFTLTSSSCADHQAYLISESSTAPAVDAAGWVACTTAAGAYSHTFSDPSSGAKSLYIWARDSASVHANRSPSQTLALTIDTAPPELVQVVINPTSAGDSVGDAFVGTPTAQIRVKATDDLATSFDLALKLIVPSSASCESQNADRIWQAYAPATPGAAVNYPVTFSPVDGTKKVCVWARDPAGNTSVIDAATPETANVNFDTISYEVGNPPQITALSITNATAGPRLGTATFLSGETVRIAYTLEDFEGLDVNPLEIALTENNTLWSDHASGADASIEMNRTWVGGIAPNQTIYSGTLDLPAPSSGYFRMRIRARDRAGNTSPVLLSNAFNLTGWDIYAGSVSNGDGGSGLGVRLYGGTPSMIAVSPTTGDVFAFDSSPSAIRRLNAKTGLVTSLIQNGTQNLVDGSPLPAASYLPLDGSRTRIVFDSKGRLYVPGTSATGIWQIDLEANVARRYFGPATSNVSGTATPNDVAWFGGAMAFDEDDSLYFLANCEPSTGNKAVRIMKATQNSDGTAGALSIVAGNCTYDQPPATGGADALTVGLGSLYNAAEGDWNLPTQRLAALAVLDHGSTIYYYGYYNANHCRKIVAGVNYRCAIPVGSNTSFKVRRADRTLISNTADRVWSYTIPLAGENGEIGTQLIGETPTGACGDEGLSAAQACPRVASVDIGPGNTLYFSDGGRENSPGSYRVRFLDSETGQVRTALGTLPFYGDGLDRTLTRGTFSGITYKTTSTPGFPAGLYFTDKTAMVVGRIDTATNQTEVLFGNQTMGPASNSNGAQWSKSVSLGGPYTGGSLHGLAFDSNNRLWVRSSSHHAVTIGADHTITHRLGGSSTAATAWDAAADGATNPGDYSLYVMALRNNVTLSPTGLFVAGRAYNATGWKEVPSIRHFDIVNSLVRKVIGDQPRATSADSVPGAAQNLSINCDYTSACYNWYDSTTERLYFTETGSSAIRYIENPLNPAASALNSIPLARNPTNFTFRPDGSEVYYLNGTQIYCKKLGVTGTCNETSLGPDPLLGSITAGANQFTWLDNETLLISNHAGMIYRLQLSTP